MKEEGRGEVEDRPSDVLLEGSTTENKKKFFLTDAKEKFERELKIYFPLKCNLSLTIGKTKKFGDFITLCMNKSWL